MLLIINILIFCIVLYIYIQIYSHNKTSNYLELYDMGNISKEKMEEIINFKQPLLLNGYMPVKDITMDNLLLNYSTFNVNIYNKQNDIYSKIRLDHYFNIVNSDSSLNKISYNNCEFLEDTSIDKILCNNDIFFRPYNLYDTKYDIIMGAINSSTPLRYSMNSRNMLYLSSGQIEVKLCPPKDYKNLHVKKNYESLEFYSQININNVESIYKSDFDKLQFITVILNMNQVLLIPPYWFYSIRFLEKHSIVFLNTYTTYVDILCMMPELSMQLLQKGNIKLNVIAKNEKNYQDKREKEEQDKEKDKEENKEEDKEKDKEKDKEEDKEEDKEKDKEENKEEDKEEKEKD